MKKKLFVQVTSCSDPMKWYAKAIGHIFPVESSTEDSRHGFREYRVRATDGYINFISKDDCLVYSQDNVEEVVPKIEAEVESLRSENTLLKIYYESLAFNNMLFNRIAGLNGKHREVADAITNCVEPLNLLYLACRKELDKLP